MSSATGNQRRASIPEVIGAWSCTSAYAAGESSSRLFRGGSWALGAGARRAGARNGVPVMIPRINDGKEKRAAQERVAEAKADAANRGAHRASEAAVGLGVAAAPTGGASATEVSAAREDLLHSVGVRDHRRRAGPRGQGRDVARAGPDDL